VAFFFDHAWPDSWTEAGLCGAIVGCQGQDLYRAEKNRHHFGTLAWSSAHDRAVEQGRILGEAVNLTRKLVNQPPDVMYPETFADAATQIARENGIEIDVWDGERLEAERCGALLAVAKGSSRPARMVKLRYAGGPKDALPLAIVGKGVTFDSGGLSLKPSDGMLTMKCDMAGAATMLGALQAIAQLKLPINVIGVAGLVENMTGPAAMKLGDVLVARNGRTIEVHNTDAEGRLVLADLLSLVVEWGAAKIVDLATLTGACVVALGTEVAGAMTNDQSWCDAIVGAARRVGEPVWQLPMYPEIYNDLIKSEVADIKNVGEGRWGGAITAAKFLEQFVGDRPWTHLDIAGPAFRDKPKPWCDAGASGQFVRTLVELARDWKT
jgi:leucyl aminopeptidase